MTLTFLFIVLFSSLFSFSQSKPFKISGTLIDKDTKTPVESATVYLEQVKDSSLITYTISNKIGKFTLEGSAHNKQAILNISYLGYKSITKQLNFTGNPILLDSIFLEENHNLLNEVLVKSRAPITIKKDTIEFNVKSFRTKMDANVEDLLKVLPGVEVDVDGGIKVNGKVVNKILVNGKPFFSNDLTIATRNLNKDMIEKVQISDTKTDIEAFTGEKAKSDAKTINLTVKKENSRSVFGRLSLGGGTDERYELAGMLNVFNDKQRISVLGGGNNINSPGFSFGSVGRMARGGSQGILTSKNAGINYADKYGKATDVSSDYFYSSSDSENKTTANTEYILPDTRFFTESSSSSINYNDNHRVNSEFKLETDNNILVTVKPSYNVSNSNAIYNSKEKSRDDNNVLTNEANASSFGDTKTTNFSNNFTFIKRLKKEGRFIMIRLNNDIGTSSSNTLFNSNTLFYDENPSDPANPVISDEIVRDQLRVGDSKTNNAYMSIGYSRIPISKHLGFNIVYNYLNNKSENKLSSFNKDTNNSYTVLDADLSTNFKYKDESNKLTLHFEYQKDKLYFSFDPIYTLRTLSSTDALRPVLNNKFNFNNFEYYNQFRYTFSKQSRLDISYILLNSAPEPSQLQAFDNILNPLNRVIGNPYLKLTNNHEVKLSFNNNIVQKQANINAGITANFKNNQIISKSTIDDDLIRTTTFENVKGNYNVNAHVGYHKSIRLDSLKSLALQLGMGSSINRNVNFNNDVKYSSMVKTIFPTIGLNFYWRDVVMFNPSYSLSFTNNSYNLQGFNDEAFAFHSFNLHTQTTFYKKLQFSNNVSYSYNPNIADGFQKSAWFWNATLGYSVFKDKGIISIKANDILKQNTNARRIATANYIQDSQSTVLQQYFMLSFSWKFNSAKAKSDHGVPPPPPTAY
ncbi:outer membrane beta-barrel protein [uncultured Wocania sp.]|uniref:outer membrane beta-barrel protein n=1 Tax=uncultured Wocania sp. TaxID=2834404 RepID=UPI0030FCE584